MIRPCLRTSFDTAVPLLPLTSRAMDSLRREIANPSGRCRTTHRYECSPVHDQTAQPSGRRVAVAAAPPHGGGQRGLHRRLDPGCNLCRLPESLCPAGIRRPVGGQQSAGLCQAVAARQQRPPHDRIKEPEPGGFRLLARRRPTGAGPVDAHHVRSRGSRWRWQWWLRW